MLTNESVLMKNSHCERLDQVGSLKPFVALVLIVLVGFDLIWPASSLWGQPTASLSIVGTATNNLRPSIGFDRKLDWATYIQQCFINPRLIYQN